MTVIVRVSMALVAVAAFALSFQSLMTLGELAGYGVLAWLYPVVVDLGTVSSCAAWLSTRSRQAFGMTWTLLGVSVLQNGTVHWLMATGRAPEWWLVTLVATVPPIVLGLTVHLAVSLASGRHTEESTAEDAPADLPPDMEAHPADSWDGEDRETPGDDRAPVTVAEGVGRRRLARQLGVSEHQARQILARSRNGDGREASDGRT